MTQPYWSTFRIFLVGTVLLAAVVCAGGQSPVDKIADTERAFARMATEQNAKAAFLAYMTDDAWFFGPDASKAKPSWEARKPSEALLEWAPNFADAGIDGS